MKYFDFFGNELKLGDYVVFVPKYQARLLVGKIVRRIKSLYSEGPGIKVQVMNIIKHSNTLTSEIFTTSAIKIDEKQVTMLCLLKDSEK